MQRHLWKRQPWLAPLLFAALLLVMPQALGQAQSSSELESEIGALVFDELRDADQIIAESPLYDVLAPIAAPIAEAAEPRYEHPIRFILVHDAKPNAFSAPGGHVYVTDSFMDFVKNAEQLAGTLCHEVSHTIHRHAMQRIEESERTMVRQFGAAILLGPGLAKLELIRAIGELHTAAYSREMESEADITGSDICANAGYNPWGLVWLFEDFEETGAEAGPQLLQDHPSNRARIRSLQAHFRNNPAVFAKFDPDRKSAIPLDVPRNASMQFLPRSDASADQSRAAPVR